MQYDPNIHSRRSIRLRDYNYSSNCLYFITICIQNRKEYFYNVGAGHWPALNTFGKMVKTGWMRILQIYDHVELDQFVIMPNHIHGIIEINNKEMSLRAAHYAALTDKTKTIGYIIGQFKSSMTKLLRKNGLSDFEWQRNYYEHIIRNEQELNSIREYILYNPIDWGKDKYNPCRDVTQTYP